MSAHDDRKSALLLQRRRYYGLPGWEQPRVKPKTTLLAGILLVVIALASAAVLVLLFPP